MPSSTYLFYKIFLLVLWIFGRKDYLELPIDVTEYAEVGQYVMKICKF